MSSSSTVAIVATSLGGVATAGALFAVISGLGGTAYRATLSLVTLLLVTTVVLLWVAREGSVAPDDGAYVAGASSGLVTEWTAPHEAPPPNAPVQGLGEQWCHRNRLPDFATCVNSVTQHRAEVLREFGDRIREDKHSTALKPS